jgi:opacity protein-like surface antigen
MRLKTRVWSMLAGVVLFGLPLTAATTFAAVDRDGFWVSIGPRATYFVPKNDKWDDGKLFGGAQLRLHFGQIFAIEGSADYRREHFDSTRVDTYPVQVSGIVYLIPNSRITPYGLFGGGWYYTHVKGPGGFNDTQNRFGAHAGGGLEFFLNRFWSLDASYRFIWLEDIKSRDANLFDKKFDDRGHMVTLAVNYHF